MDPLGPSKPQNKGNASPWPFPQATKQRESLASGLLGLPLAPASQKPNGKHFPGTPPGHKTKRKRKAWGGSPPLTQMGGPSLWGGQCAGLLGFVGAVPYMLGLLWPSFRPKSGSKSKISSRILLSFRGPFSSAEREPLWAATVLRTRGRGLRFSFVERGCPSTKSL